jgi:hypothetical protein
VIHTYLVTAWLIITASIIKTNGTLGHFDLSSSDFTDRFVAGSIPSEQLLILSKVIIPIE